MAVTPPTVSTGRFLFRITDPGDGAGNSSTPTRRDNMAFSISPGINITEIDRTGVVNQIVSQTSAAYAGNFKWGPVEEIKTIRTENELIANYGYPTEENYKDFFTVANYLSYGAPMQVIRAANDTVKIATVGGGGIGASAIWNDAEYEDLTDYGLVNAGAGYTGTLVAKYPGSLGNSLKISFSDNISRGLTFAAISTAVTAGSFITWSGQYGSLGISLGAGVSPIAGASAIEKVAVGDSIKFGTSSLEFLVTGTTLSTSSGAGNAVTFLVSGTTSSVATSLLGLTQATINWAYSRYVPYTPNTSNAAAKLGYFNDEVAFAVIDEDGLFTGTPGRVVESFIGSKASNATLVDGTNNYYNIALSASKYVRWIGHPENNLLLGPTVSIYKAFGATFNPLGATVDGKTFGFQPLKANVYASLNGGTDAVVGNSEILSAYSIFEDSENTESNLLLQGGHGVEIAKYLVDLADERKDAIVFLSPRETDVVGKSIEEAYENVLNYKTNVLAKDSSYAFLDSGWKYMYDKYFDTYRWMPLNPDVAGLVARTGTDAAPWFSPAGYNRGIIRNVVRLAFNPSKVYRDGLYTNNINPVITQPGVGTLLFGDKTLFSKPSSFSRINVRRLFIALEKTVATAAKFQLFEFNDEFTRANFIGLVEPFLRQVQAQRGITDFKVICDETNNTPDIVDSNQFVADIYIKAASSINYIQLNFIATRSDVDFNEVGAAVNI